MSGSGLVPSALQSLGTSAELFVIYMEYLVS